MVLKDAGVVQTYETIIHPLLLCWDMVGRKGTENIIGAVLQSLPKATKEAAKFGKMTCCQSGISSKRRCSGGLRRNWEVSEKGRAGRFLEEWSLL